MPPRHSRPASLLAAAVAAACLLTFLAGSKPRLGSSVAVRRPVAPRSPCHVAHASRPSRVMRRVQEKSSSSLDSLSSLLGGLEDNAAADSTPAAAAAAAAPAFDPAAYSGIENLLNQGENIDDAKLVQELTQLKEEGRLQRWGSAVAGQRSRSISFNQLIGVGIKKPEVLAGGDVEDDLALLVAYVLFSSVLAVIAGNTLPGQLGFFVPYLVAGSSLVLLAIGSTNPGLLQVPKDRLARLNPEYERRLVRHEAAHFLAGYLLGFPIKGYSVNAPTALSPHVEFAEFLDDGERAKDLLSREELERMGPLAMSGLAAEGLEFDNVKGGQADLLQLQLMMNRAKPRMSAEEQQDFTRWSVYRAIELLKYNRKAHDALTEAMQEGKPVWECIRVIEGL